MLCLLGRDVWAGGALSAGRTSNPSDDIAVGVQAALGGIGVAVGSADRGELVLRVDGGGDEGQHGGAEHGVRRGLSVAVYVGANQRVHSSVGDDPISSTMKHMAGTLGRPSAFDLLRKGGHQVTSSATRRTTMAGSSSRGSGGQHRVGVMPAQPLAVGPPS